jgi:hypothetical protein
MRYFINPLQDASVYSQFANRNTGLDEILEVGKTNNGTDKARALVQFDLTNFAGLPSGTRFDLVLYLAQADKLKAAQGVEVCQVSQSWAEGTNYFYGEVTSSVDGATWTQNSSGSSWVSGSQGGSHLPTTVSQSSANPITDFTFDVTSYVQQWLTGSVPNFGFLVKFPDADESSLFNQGNIRFFSNQTHTIYKPVLVARWDDSSYVTGSNSWPTSSLHVVPAIETFYSVGETVRVDLAVREKWPLKTFNNSASVFAGNHYLPTSSYYSVVDEQSGTTIIPFSNESKISTSGDQSFFTFKVQNMYPRRYYRVLIKVLHDGQEQVFDENSVFGVK